MNTPHPTALSSPLGLLATATPLPSLANYQSPRVRAAAARVILHGSIDDLSPEVALTAGLATTSLRRDETKPEVIEIDFATPVDSAVRSRPTH